MPLFAVGGMQNVATLTGFVGSGMPVAVIVGQEALAALCQRAEAAAMPMLFGSQSALLSTGWKPRR
jgi:hypothetical protein